ncbi:Condensation domain protein, partial [Metarhizium hybridum]
MDGSSLEVIIKDLPQLYDNKSLSVVPMQCPDFSIMQHKEFYDGEWENEVSHWKSEFATIPKPLPVLPPAKKISRAPLGICRSNTTRH